MVNYVLIMSDDSTKLSVSKKNKNNSDDFCPLLVEIIKSVEYKYYAFMFLVFMFITSDVYLERILSQIDGALEYQVPTPYGTIIQALTLVGVMLLIHVLIKKEIV